MRDHPSGCCWCWWSCLLCLARRGWVSSWWPAGAQQVVLLRQQCIALHPLVSVCSPRRSIAAVVTLRARSTNVCVRRQMAASEARVWATWLTPAHSCVGTMLVIVHRQYSSGGFAAHNPPHPGTRHRYLQQLDLSPCCAPTHETGSFGVDRGQFLPCMYFTHILACP